MDIPKVLTYFNGYHDYEIENYFSLSAVSGESEKNFKNRISNRIDEYFRKTKETFISDNARKSKKKRLLNISMDGTTKMRSPEHSSFVMWCQMETFRHKMNQRDKMLENNKKIEIEKKTITIEINLDYKKMYEDLKSEHKKLKVKYDKEKLKNRCKSPDPDPESEIRSKTPPKENKPPPKKTETIEDPTFKFRLTNAKRMLKNKSFSDSSMVHALDNINSYIDDNDKNPELISQFENWIPTMREFSPNEDVYEEFEDRCNKRLATFQ